MTSPFTAVNEVRTTREPKTRLLRVTMTVAVRDMNDAEYEEAMVGVEYDPEEWDAEYDGDPRAVVDATEPNDYRELIEAATDSETNPELFAGSGIFAVMGAAHVESIEWIEQSAESSS